MQEGRSRHLGNGVFVKLAGDVVMVTFEGWDYDKVTLLWDGWNTVTLRSAARGVCGLCGNNNGQQSDEFRNIWFHGNSFIGEELENIVLTF